MAIKALFFDIDGTLVSFKTHQIPESTVDALRKVHDKGVKIFISTGRPHPNPAIKRNRNPMGSICLNGFRDSLPCAFGVGSPNQYEV